jgi:hypothetical protein
MNYTPPKGSVTRKRNRFKCHATPNGIYIPFSKIFQRDLAVLDEVVLTSKRMFLNHNEMLAHTAECIINHPACDSIPEYLRILYRIRTEMMSYTLPDLIRDIMVGDPATNTPPVLSANVIQIISELQEAIYIKELDDISDKEENINEELQITDYHAIEILKIAMACRYVSPLICEFINITNIAPDEVLYSVFIQIYLRMTPPDLDLIGKITKFVESRILQTLRHNQVSWNFYTNYGEDKNTRTIETVKSLMCEVIPKLEGRVVGYLHKTITNKIDHFFRTNPRIRLMPCRLWNAQEHPDGLDSFDRHNVLGMTQELYRTIDRENIEKLLGNLRNSMGVITPEKFNYYERLQLNRYDLSRRLLFIFYAKHLGDYQSMYTLNSHEYYEFLIYLVDWLTASHRLLSIRDLLLAIPMPKPPENQSRISQRLSSSAGYRTMLQTRYPYVKYQMLNSNGVGELLDMMSQDFYRTPLLEEWVEIVNSGNHVNYQWQSIDYTPEHICNELIELIEM